MRFNATCSEPKTQDLWLSISLGDKEVNAITFAKTSYSWENGFLYLDVDIKNDLPHYDIVSPYSISDKVFMPRNKLIKWQ